jgi:hypothetical protein
MNLKVLAITDLSRMTKIIQSLFAEFIRKYILPLIKLREEERVTYPSKVSIFENIRTCFIS